MEREEEQRGYTATKVYHLLKKSEYPTVAIIKESGVYVEEDNLQKQNAESL